MSQRADFAFPIPFLVLLTTVAASGALGGFVSGLISGLLMSVTILYFWSIGVGPVPLTGTLTRAILGSLTAITIGAYLGLMREQLSGLLSELEARQLELTRMNDELAQRVASRTADLQRVTRRWIQAEEAERRNLARDLHDDVGQRLTALHLNLESSKKAFAVNPRLQEFSATARELVNQITGSVQQLSLKLRPSLLDDLGLIAAVRENAAMQFDVAGIEYDLQHEGKDDAIDSNIGITAFRLVQEALTNIVKHSEASRVSINIRIDNQTLKIHVRDNGNGFERHRTGDGPQEFGIVAMQERASLMSGSYEVRSEPGRGTDVDITLPLSDEGVAP